MPLCSIDRFDRQIEIVPGKNTGNVHLLVCFDAGIDSPRAILRGLFGGGEDRFRLFLIGCGRFVL